MQYTENKGINNGYVVKYDAGRSIRAAPLHCLSATAVRLGCDSVFTSAI